MLLVRDSGLDASTLAGLARLQSVVDASADYALRVQAAKDQWHRKSSGSAGKQLFESIRTTLRAMCGDLVRCMYCEDSVADEVEHVLPKSFFPCSTFAWENLGYACGPCNGTKSNKYGVVGVGQVVPFSRRRNDPILPPPSGPSAFLNPRIDDALGFFDLDLGGVAASGQVVEGTFEMLVKDDISLIDKLRAEFTRKTLNLNSDLLLASRRNAFGGYIARLKQYSGEKVQGAVPARLESLKRDILITPHPTVFVEMIRQRVLLPEVDRCVDTCPEILGWRR